MLRILIFAVCGLIASSICARAADDMNTIAEKYAHLVLALGQHDPDYVDAFYGPAEWKTQASNSSPRFTADRSQESCPSLLSTNRL